MALNCVLMAQRCIHICILVIVYIWCRCIVYAWVDHGHFLGHQLDGPPHLGTYSMDFLGRKLETDVVLFNIGVQLNAVGQVNSLEIGFTDILNSWYSLQNNTSPF